MRAMRESEWSLSLGTVVDKLPRGLPNFVMMAWKSVAGNILSTQSEENEVMRTSSPNTDCETVSRIRASWSKVSDMYFCMRRKRFVRSIRCVSSSLCTRCRRCGVQ